MVINKEPMGYDTQLEFGRNFLVVGVIFYRKISAENVQSMGTAWFNDPRDTFWVISETAG